MSFKKHLLAMLAGGLTMWILAGVWHEILAARFYAAETGTEHQGLGIILVAYLVLGLLMAYVYPLGYKGGRAVVEGLRFGMLIGVLWVFPHGLAMDDAAHLPRALDAEATVHPHWMKLSGGD